MWIELVKLKEIPSGLIMMLTRVGINGCRKKSNKKKTSGIYMSMNSLVS